MCANKLRSHCIWTSKAIFQLSLSWKTFRYPAPIGHLLSPYPATTRRSAQRSANFLRRSSSLFLPGLASGANFLFYIFLFWFLNGRIEVLVKISPSPCWGDFPGIIDRGLIKKGQQESLFFQSILCKFKYIRYLSLEVRRLLPRSRWTSFGWWVFLPVLAVGSTGEKDY